MGSPIGPLIHLKYDQKGFRQVNLKVDCPVRDLRLQTRSQAEKKEFDY
jgi:hypothetical protein